MAHRFRALISLPQTRIWFRASTQQLTMVYKSYFKNSVCITQAWDKHTCRQILTHKIKRSMFRERLSHPKAVTHFHYVWTQSIIPWDRAARKQDCLLRSTDVEHCMGKKNLGSLLAKFSNFKMHLIRSGILCLKGDSPGSASWVLELKAYTTTFGLSLLYFQISHRNFIFVQTWICGYRGLNKETKLFVKWYLNERTKQNVVNFPPSMYLS